ncbi:endonuclease/exonuclease/phosphatase family protein [Blastopirellula retiformator]|uniref:Endonuclease/exonuclease/phosphatase domain-containing protein n=1 Tax=Blastopirellula retiformator TaxID=2527970 RepID=A0A5C5VKV0_9BACT|nr:endonuclease/exonuclease/phosphatase family protein [Blastopirellula retiformator]TWT39216.1 hypothetical protein Enr8_09120 [Blastopirellula retiformator]
MNCSPLAITIALLFASFASAETPQSLRVLSYNIHHCEGSDGKVDLPRIAKVIKSAAPDVVLLQEVDRHVARSGNIDQAVEIGRLTGMHVAFGGNLKIREGDYGNAILSRYPLRDVENRQLPNSNGGEPRGVLSVVVTVPNAEGEQDCRILATHFDHRPAPVDRLASVDDIEQWLSTENRLVVLGGDFNATQVSSVLEQIRKSWRLAVDGQKPTFPATTPSRQIDFISYRSPAPIQVSEVRVLDEAVASDHRPILATLILAGDQ